VMNTGLSGLSSTSAIEAKSTPQFYINLHTKHLP
jgi:hypothetical protein